MRDFVSEHGKFVVTNNAPIFAAVSGYDKNPRDLWEIPRGISLCQRAIESGLLSLRAPKICEHRLPELLCAWIP